MQYELQNLVENSNDKTLRKWFPTPKADRSTFEFVDEESKSMQKLKCAICLDILNDPVVHSQSYDKFYLTQVDGCRQSFCKDCVKTLNQCPLCKKICTLGSFQKAPVVMINWIDDLEVKCNQCSIQTTHSHINHHIHCECKIDCVNGCGKKYTPKFENHHLETCVKKPIECSASICGCNWKGPQDSLRAHESTCVLRQKALSNYEKLISRNITLKNSVRTFSEKQSTTLDVLKQAAKRLLKNCKKNDQFEISYNGSQNEWHRVRVISRRLFNVTFKTNTEKIIKYNMRHPNGLLCGPPGTFSRLALHDCDDCDASDY